MDILRKMVVCVGFIVCCILFLPAAATPESSADQVRKELADAFEKKDIATVHTLIFDGHSGLRFFIGATIDGFWKPVGSALRKAELKLSQEKNVTYLVSIQWPNASVEKREVTIILGNEGWALDLNSLLGPFPHL